MFKTLFLEILYCILFVAAVGLMLAIIAIGESRHWVFGITVGLAVGSDFMSAWGLVVYEEKFLNV